MISTTCLLTILSCSACVYAPIPKLPELPKIQPKESSPVATICPDVKRQACPEQEKTECSRIEMPAPIPKTIDLVIRDGKVVKADAGGQALVRSYAATRKAIKSQWSGSPQ